MKYRTLWRFAAALLAVGSLMTTIVQGQTIQGQINGIVTDPSGSVIAGADIVLRSLDTDSERKTVSAEGGVYFLSSVPPGRYSLTVSAQGFQSYRVSDLTLSVNQAQTINVQMAVGAVTQTVNVEAAAVALNTTDATIGTLIQHQDIVEIPLDGRNFTQLIMLSPGVAPIQTGQQNAFIITGGISPAVNGLRPQMNDFTLDGIENNQRFSNSYAVSPPPDAIAEFKVASHQTGADVSLAAGANVNLVTQSGTNLFHGSAWDFLRNNVLDARNYFDNFFGSPTLPFRQNQFGFFVGGPVFLPHVIDGRKTHTFFSTYYEGLRNSRTITTQATVPNAAERSGNFSDLLGAQIGTDCLGRPILQGEIYDPTTTVANAACPQGFVRDPFPNNTVPSIDPVAAAYLKYYYPPSNRADTPNLVLAQNSTRISDQYGIRVDQTISDRSSIFGRVAHYNYKVSSPGGLPENPFVQQNHGTNVAGHYNHVFSTTFIADFLFGYNRSGIPIYFPGIGGADGAAFDQAVGPNFFNTFTASGNVPSGQGLGGSRFSSPAFVSYELANPDTTFQYNADFKKVRKSHEMSFGFRFMRYRHIAGAQGAASQGYAPETTGLPGISNTGESLASFMLGLPTTSGRFLYPPFNDFGNIYNGYFGDTWKVTPKFTLNLGLQYVYAAPPTVEGNTISLFDWDKAQTQPNATDFTYAYYWCAKNPITGAPPNCPTPQLMRTDKNDWAPRLGIAYAPLKDTVIRGGFGVFYDFNSNIEQNSIRVSQANWPFSNSVRWSGQNLTTLGPLNPILTLSNPYPVPPNGPPPNSNQSISRFNLTPYAMEWNFGIERLLPLDFKLSVDYVGAAGRRLIETFYQNQAVLGSGSIDSRRPVHNAGVFPWRHNIGRSSYNGLQMKLERQFKSGFTFLNSFTWSKSLDTQSDANNVLGPPSYTYDINLSHGPSDFNIPFVNTTSFVYALPFGRGKRFAANAGGVLNQVIGGWETSSIITFRSGLGYSIIIGQDIANIGDVSGNQTANAVSAPVPSSFNQTRAAWFDPAAFQLPAFGTLGDSRRNFLLGPAYQNVDLALTKVFPIKERLNLQFRTEFFNLANHTNFQNPDNSLASSTFGQVLAAYGSREIQFALKVRW